MACRGVNVEVIDGQEPTADKSEIKDEREFDLGDYRSRMAVVLQCEG